MGEGTLGSPRDPMGRGPGPPVGRERLGAQGIPWEATLGAPIGFPFNLFAMEPPSKNDENHDNHVF